jgi:hypothetical protein
MYVTIIQTDVCHNICRDYCDIHLLSGLLWHTSVGIIVTYICRDYCDIILSGLLWHTSFGIIVTYISRDYCDIHLSGLLWHTSVRIIVTYICRDYCDIHLSGLLWHISVRIIVAYICSRIYCVCNWRNFTWDTNSIQWTPTKDILSENQFFSLIDIKWKFINSDNHKFHHYQ